jgi:hypothetical protein
MVGSAGVLSLVDGAESIAMKSFDDEVVVANATAKSSAHAPTHHRSQAPAFSSYVHATIR